MLWVLVLHLIAIGIVSSQLAHKSQDTADSTFMKYTGQPIDRRRETARRRVLYLCYVPHVPGTCCRTVKNHQK
ncbi:hypothetical protein [Microcoleus sp. PH2017_25_DOB_D_A]|uniref:hypothetical protein n=1 Tax=Microcoleus sp. PH2017_25_DOB_D_A TaxID=2798835 RepID=UPI001D9B7F99|nr:hypothetical protein [Microcoleus sp. PH2017_25_DOB_D_A]MCC3509489.1 hypothetical protein [Microcoleus sp. PH2017_17_BER_D_A]MCC3545491.1 hypothetical protein [Microcoleus sp. PH2017_24_DOB_U_A]